MPSLLNQSLRCVGHVTERIQFNCDFLGSQRETAICCGRAIFQWV